MKPARKSRNLSRTKVERGTLPRHWQEEILRCWLNWLLDPAFSTTLRSSDTNARLRKLRAQITRLKKMPVSFVDEDGSFYISKAVASLENEEKHLLVERRTRTYECGFFGRTAPKELGNIELAERFGVSFFLLRRLKPTENPYSVLQKELESRQIFSTAKAIQMKERRLEANIRAGRHMPWPEILRYQYRCFKYFSGMNIWFGRSTGLPPVGYLKKCLTLTVHEMDLLRSLVTSVEIS